MKDILIFNKSTFIFLLYDNIYDNIHKTKKMNGKGNFIIFEYDMEKENENEYKNLGKYLNNYISAIFDIDGFKLFKFENKIIVGAYSGYYIVDMNIKKIVSFIKFKMKKILKNKFFK